MKRPDSPVPAALAAYVGVTVLLPLLTGNRGPDFLQHALSVLASATLIGSAWWGLERLSRTRAQSGRAVPSAPGLLDRRRDRPLVPRRGGRPE